MRKYASMIGRALRGAIWLFAATTFASLGPAHSQTYPSRPIKMIVPFTPGTSMDIVARTVGEEPCAASGG